MNTSMTTYDMRCCHLAMAYCRLCAVKATYRLELEYTKATFKTVKFEFQNFKYFRASHTVFHSCVILLGKESHSKCSYF